MYNFNQIRSAIMAVEQPPKTFPYGLETSPEFWRGLRTAPHLQKLVGEIRAEAEEASTTPIPPLPFSSFHLFMTKGTRQEYERPYFKRRGRLIGLVLATLLDETGQYLPVIQDILWEICNEYSWSVPAHLGIWAKPDAVGPTEYFVPPEHMVDLFAAETSHSLAETLWLLGSRLEPWVVLRVRHEIERRVFEPLFNSPVHFGWESSTNNWAAVCGGAVGMAALLTVTDRERLAGMIERTVRTMESFLLGYSDDGGCTEGISYWQYGYGYYAYFALMLSDFTGGQLDLLAGDKIRAIAEFPAHVNLSGTTFVNYADGGSRTGLSCGLMARLMERLHITVPPIVGIPAFYADSCYRWPNITRNLFWTPADIFNQPDTPGIFYLPDLQVVVARHQNENGATVAFSAKGGHNDEAHNHNDVGNFILHVGGENILADLGAGLYTAEYFQAQHRYSFWHNGSQGHSVPVINGQYQSPGRSHAAQVLDYSQTEDSVRLGLDVTAAYGGADLRRFTRAFDWHWNGDEGRLTITDNLNFATASATLEEVFISLIEPELEARAGRIEWRGGAGAVELEYDPAQWRGEIEPIDTLNHAGQAMTFYRARLQLAKAGPDVQSELVFTARPKA